MSRLLSIRKVYDMFVLCALALAMFALIRFPEESISAAAEGLRLSFHVIIPSLFPFFVLSGLMIRLGLTQYFGRVLEPFMRPLFNVPGIGASPFVLGFIGGYPVGAKTTITLYEDGHITKVEAERLLAFSNNSGPAFILGVVGVGIFASSRIGLLLYIAHALSSILVGLIFRFWGYYRPGGGGRNIRAKTSVVRFMPAFLTSVTSAFHSTLNICAFVTFFTVFIRLLFLSGAIPATAAILGTMFASFGFDSYWASMLLTGIIELSSGVWSLRDAAGQLSSSIAMAAFMLGWAGISVHCQVLSFIGDSGLSVRAYILGKSMHGIISAILIFFITQFFPLPLAVSGALADGVYGIATMDFSSTFVISSLAALFVCMLTFSISLFPRKKTRQTK